MLTHKSYNFVFQDNLQEAGSANQQQQQQQQPQETGGFDIKNVQDHILAAEIHRRALRVVGAEEACPGEAEPSLQNYTYSELRQEAHRRRTEPSIGGVEEGGQGTSEGQQLQQEQQVEEEAERRSREQSIPGVVPKTVVAAAAASGASAKAGGRAGATDTSGLVC